MKTSDFDYSLPPELIAQTPIEPRDHARLLVLNREDGSIEHKRFFEITDYLRKGDVLVFNDSRVIPARLRGIKAVSGGKVEILLTKRVGANTWEALVKPGKRVGIGTTVEFSNSNGKKISAEVIALKEEGIKVVKFSDESLLPELGAIPLPPYIHIPLGDKGRYQTVYAKIDGSVAAPTAGLHFTPELLRRLKDKSVSCQFVTLHVGLDTFRPVREENPFEHPVYKEYGVLSAEVARELSSARTEGQRIICVGTTSTRIVEQAAQLSEHDKLEPFEGLVSLLILPGHKFHMADALITNFHLPETTLLMLVSAFAGKGLIDKAYQEAIAQKYRFYSFGDAMLIL